MMMGNSLERNQTSLAYRSLSILLLCAVVFTPLGLNSDSWAYQDAAKTPPTGEAPAATPAPAGEAPAPAAAPAPAGDAAGGGDAPAAAPAAATESFLSWMIRASGFFGLILLLLSFLMVALIMANVLSIRRDNLMPPDLIAAFEEKINTKDYQGAYELAKSDDSFVARVLAAGLSKLNQGYAEAVEGMQEVGEDENMAMEHKLSYLALIGAIAPMIGLMGTVYGMILSFQTIANSATSPKPSELADGISTALFTTLEGLTVAIPAMIFYSLLRNRVSRFSLEVGMISESLMNRFSSTSK
ncbi:MAG: MotA/TolQ/ExbB proton channel family protein [Planctomycetes bacterium]|nr:MotA/TolQ/ExbB proton channel family protein [Planctomycetota bacterium]MCH9727668.1 MotA/TolQ/ExbB proton channel family protein [Planctomycetota bacterium]MCH9775093.1 MotA/TolQ/ExbB proton channel family protein [Planctomycetota bacterium]MCH9790232.1 MotA/TolQ/ExbB proton channel family protein [Planctomycetota bacterium]